MGNIVYAANGLVDGQLVLNISYTIIGLCILIGIVSVIMTLIKNMHDVKTVRIKRKRALIFILILLIIICSIIIYSIPLMKTLIN